jgi:hypothetical protein
MVFQPVTATDKVDGIGRRKIGKILALFFKDFQKSFSDVCLTFPG